MESDGFLVLVLVLMFIGAWLAAMVFFTWRILALLGDTAVGQYLLHGLRHDKALPNIICCVGVILAVTVVAILAYGFFFMIRYSRLFATVRGYSGGHATARVAFHPWNYIAYFTVLSVVWLVVVGLITGVIRGIEGRKDDSRIDSDDFF